MSMKIRKSPIKADDEVMDAPVAEGEVEVEPEVTELLFETEDVAELLAEATGEDVEAEASDDGESVVFDIGTDEFTVTPEEDVEIVESSHKKLAGKKNVQASARRSMRRKAPVAASKRATANRTARKTYHPSTK